MIIGILTYHRSHNYGALLQAIALRVVLTNMGHKVSFIDYWPAYHNRMYALFSLKKLNSINCVRDKIRYIVDCFIHYNVRKQRINNFNYFITKYIAPYISSDDASMSIHSSIVIDVLVGTALDTIFTPFCKSLFEHISLILLYNSFRVL